MKVKPRQDRRQEALQYLAIMDTILQSLAGIHEVYKDHQEELHKKVSVRKLKLMEDLYELTSPLS